MNSKLVIDLPESGWHDSQLEIQVHPARTSICFEGGGTVGALQEPYVLSWSTKHKSHRDCLRAREERVNILNPRQLCVQTTHIETTRNHYETIHETTRFLSHFPRNRWIL